VKISEISDIFYFFVFSYFSEDPIRDTKTIPKFRDSLTKMNF